MTATPLLAEADSKSLDVAGLEPLVSEAFYEVDINATDPVVEAEGWTLTVTGAVDQNLNGKKLDYAVWTGVPVIDLIEPAGLPEGCCVMLRAADDFYEELPRRRPDRGRRPRLRRHPRDRAGGGVD